MKIKSINPTDNSTIKEYDSYSDQTVNDIINQSNQDFLVFTMDGRGSENRGKEFEQIIFNQLGEIEMQDQILGYNYLKSLYLLIG